MNVKAVVPLILAVVLGLVAAVLVRNAIARKSAAPAASNLVAVAVAKQDADPGKQLTKDDVTLAKVPAELAPGHVFSDPNQLIGRVLTSPLAKGQTILETLLAPAGTGEGLQALIPQGMRAVTLEVNEYSGVGGMLAPGCRVDLVSVLRDEKSNQSIARTVLQNIKVSAIGRNVTAPHPEPGQPLPPPSNSITLLCTPKQAQTLELASQQSRPWLVLRSTQDSVQVPLEGTTYAEIKGEPSSTEDGTSVAGRPATPGTAGVLGEATTKPSDVADADPAPTTVRRTVTLIQGGTAREVTLTMPIARPTTADDRGEVIPQR